MSVARLAALRWLRDRVGDLAMYFAWRVEQFERVERDRQHAEEWRAEIGRSRGDAGSS